MRVLYDSGPAPSIIFFLLNQIEDLAMQIPYLGISTKTLFKLSLASDLAVIAFAVFAPVPIQCRSLSPQAFT